MAYLSSYIEEDFSFVKQSSYAESVRECYKQYLKYKKDDEELNIQNNLGYKVNPWFLTNKNNKYYKPRFEINTMFDREIKRMAQKLIEKYGEQEENPLI